jgi:hypothetical protein
LKETWDFKYLRYSIFKTRGRLGFMRKLFT